MLIATAKTSKNPKATESHSASSTYSSQEASQPLREKALPLTDTFERWLLEEFQSIDHAAEAEGCQPAELVAVLTPWVREIRQFAHESLLRPSDDGDARRLKEALDRALDLIEAHYVRRGKPVASFVGDLLPVANLLGDLALAWRGLRRRPECRGSRG